MKAKAICPKCDGRHILHVREVADQSSAATHHVGRDAPTTARLAFRMEQKKALIGTFEGVTTEGRLEAYVCRGCGFVEQYLIDVNELTIDNDYITEHKVDRAADG